MAEKDTEKFLVNTPYETPNGEVFKIDTAGNYGGRYGIMQSFDGGNNWKYTGVSVPGNTDVSTKIIKELKNGNTIDNIVNGKDSYIELNENQIKNLGLDSSTIPNEYELTHPKTNGIQDLDYDIGFSKKGLFGKKYYIKPNKLDLSKLDDNYSVLQGDYTYSVDKNSYNNYFNEISEQLKNKKDSFQKIEVALDAKDDQHGEYIVDDDELVQRREDARKNGDKEEEKKIQAEINRRNQAGELDSKYNSNTNENDFQVGAETQTDTPTDTQTETQTETESPTESPTEFPAITPMLMKEHTIELNDKQVKEMFGIDPNELPSKYEKDDPKFSNAIGYRDSAGFIKIDPNKITDNKELIYKIKNDYRYGIGNEFLRYDDGSYVITDDDLDSWLSNNPKNTDLKRFVRGTRSTRKALEKSPKKKNTYWTNYIYGNDIGSTNNKEAAVNKEEKIDNFLKNNPNMIKAIFGKNSGLNFGERVLRLGELLATLGANAALGAYTGFNKMTPPETVKGKYSEIYKNALKNQYERKQEVFKSENEATIDKAKRLSIIKSSPILNSLPTDILDLFADRAVVGLSEEEWNNVKNKLERNGYDDNDINEVKRTFNALRNTFSDVTTQRTNVVELNGKEFDLMRKPQAAILELEKQKSELQKMIVEVDSMPFDKLKDFMTSYKSIYSGIQSVSDSMSENKDFKYSSSLNANLGIPFGGSGAGVNVGADSGSGSENSTTTQIDKMALEGLATGKTTAEEWNKATKESKNALKASIQAAIDEINEQIKALKNFHSIDDGIVKAPHMKQWIVREDGTRIELNPNDNIYATKNELTTNKDNSKEDIIPMEKEDRVVVIQKKLGYDGNKKIIKQSDYYLTKLRK